MNLIITVSFFVLWAILSYTNIKADVPQISTIHSTQLEVEKELQNLSTNCASRITMDTKNPATTDQKSEGSLWYNTSTNKIWIREVTGWVQLN